MGDQRSTATRSRRWESDLLEDLLFFVLIVLIITPVWVLPQIPSQDGPTHLYNAMLLHSWWDPGSSYAKVFFALNHVPVPNAVSTIALALLMQLFSPQLSDKLLLTCYLGLLPISLRYAARSFGDAHYTYFIGFPLIWNYLFRMGFLNFSLSLIVALVLIGYWKKHREHMDLPHIVAICALSCLLYFCNALSFYIASGTLGLLAIGEAGWRWRANILSSQFGLIPVVPLSVWYLAARDNHAGSIGYTSFTSLVWSLTRQVVLLPAFGPIATKASALYGVLLVIAVGTGFYFRRSARVLPSDAVLLSAVVCLCLYFVVPTHVGGIGFLNGRMILYALVLTVVWICAQPFGRKLAMNLALLSILLGAISVHRPVGG